ncbi:cell surface A33 antigen [Oryzias latipes]|uniref:Ig-like domain-containing protein n=1 Tax=Oryzias latipes TaxID=8090 RepID=A0A3B3IK04_ORYLA|nr:cell surface A33 antigen [Oryzias latipes]
MTSRTLVEWKTLILLLSAFLCCWGLDVSIPKQEYTVKKGEDVELICNFKPAVAIANNFLLTWDAYPDVTGAPLKTVASYFLNSPVDIAPNYEGRASLEVNVERKTSTLRLTGVTMKDSRHYQCSVKISGDDEGTTAASTSVLVLEPPSPPICRIQGKVEYYHDINLTCMSEEGSPKPVYTWTTFSVENIPRQFPPKTTQKDGVLSLYNISRETSGYFICTSKNSIAVASCNVTLAVVPGSMNIGATAGIIGGVLAGLLVVGILIFCICKRKNKKGKYAQRSPGDIEFSDKDDPVVEELDMEDKSNTANKNISHQKGMNDKTGEIGQMLDVDQFSYKSSSVGVKDGKGSDFDSVRYQDDQHNHYRGSREHLDDQRDHYGSRDRLDDRRENYGSRDHLDNRQRYGSRDNLDDQRGRYGGSRDRLDDRTERYGSRDRLDDRSERHGSRDRLDDRSERYGSRDRLDDRSERHGSRDRLDDHSDQYQGSDRGDHYSDRHYRD